MSNDNQRSSNLRNFFARVLCGKQAIMTSNAKLFLEAICEQPDPATCIQRLVASSHGFPALRLAVRTSTSRSFLNDIIAALLRYIQAPDLKGLCGGDILRQIIYTIVDPPLVWDALVDLVRDDFATEDGLKGFSWLLLQLVSLPGDKGRRYYPVVEETRILNKLLTSSQLDVRTRGTRIQHIVNSVNSLSKNIESAIDGPGGRHDNDFADIQKIAILPTPDELASRNPFLRRAIEVYENQDKVCDLALHVDNQFRLLREDMMRDLREEIQAILTPGKRPRRGFCVENLSLHGVVADEKKPWSLQLRCMQDLPQLLGKFAKERKKFVKENPNYLKSESTACLMIDGAIIALATLVRDEELLTQFPPVICLRISEASTESALLRIKTTRKNVKLIQLNTALFSYEPVLRQLKEIRELSLESSILRWQNGQDLQAPLYSLTPNLLSTISCLTRDPGRDLKGVLELPRPTKLDASQAACFVAGVQQKISLVQGPPGTGKSFLGSLIAKAIYCHSKETILIVCYTHHALDQFLEDLLDLDILESDIIRLGSSTKATAKTSPLSLYNQRSTVKMNHSQWLMMNIHKQNSTTQAQYLEKSFDNFMTTEANKHDIMEHLEFQLDGPQFFDAFRIPEEEGNMIRVGRRGRAIDPFYLLDRWCRGKDAGMFSGRMESSHDEVWNMKADSRMKAPNNWKTDIMKEQVTQCHERGTSYNDSVDKINAIHMEKDLQVIRRKRIIGCTTTAAAKYVQILQSIAPGVLLVEEAGEIQESHILTALGPDTKQMILIGDHKQLRPKVHYDLSVEKGDGFDLNRSLFERLVLRGYPHQILRQQHRMRPEISALVREMTYPDLVDAPSTRGRPDLKGFRDNLIFMNHKEPEIETPDIPDSKDPTSAGSKKNMFEVLMTLKCVRYLGQQGYGTDSLVVLTPYLGQLRLLLDELRKDNDPVLNDLDSYDLVRAGLMPAASANLKKPRIKISTIDNYQGEEADIVIVSMTRSNIRGDIGFMISPERLNVLISRARNALIMIGNAETFMNSRKGKELWSRFMELLKSGRHIYDGFPVKCERHPDHRGLLRRPEDFDDHCPDGGCFEPCGVILNCRVHKCPHYCHQLHDHSKMLCEHIVEFKCPRGHAQKRKCHMNQLLSCRSCQRDDKRREKELQAEAEQQEDRERRNREHAEKMAELDQKIRLIREKAADNKAAEENARALEQKKLDLEAAKRLTSHTPATLMNIATKTTLAASGAVSSSQNQLTISPKDAAVAATALVKNPDSKAPRAVLSDLDSEELECEREWSRQKRVDGASNDSIDSLMALTGLEDVKSKILTIKSKIELVQRQGTDLRNERFGLVLLGNPGTGKTLTDPTKLLQWISFGADETTGKTTVARLYAKFLTSVGVLPGSEFVETTGSRLASEGVNGVKKQVEIILKDGGGAFFLDEAYQLASGNNAGGSSVLDFLLAEIENQVGKIVFILAGYTKEMEKFFEHNPGFDSRMPHRLVFADYNDKDLLKMLCRLLEKKYNGRAKIEGGNTGLYTRIAIRRLGRGRGREGYGNARALENVWSKIGDRQTSRIQKERAAGKKPDDLFWTKEDIIGPEPSGALQESVAWKELQGLIGLKAVKESIKVLVDRLQLNYGRELEELPPIEVSLNRVFLGSPGTGKTSVGKLYGAILADMGLLSKREVVIKNPSDFVGSVLGETEKNTKAILKSSEGKVLIIDEAYMLHSGSKSTGNASDPYKTAAIDTIVAEVQSTPGEDRCVLLLGYKEEMEEMLENSNPGLARRFQLSYAFHFDDFDDEQLRQILELKLDKQGLHATEEAKDVAISILARARDRPNFGNAGEVENLLSHAKASEQNRRSSMGGIQGASNTTQIIFLPQDFDKEFDRGKNASLNCRKLFSDVVGCENIVEKLEEYQRVAATMKARRQDPRPYTPFNFIFKGPPGTGKTTTAQKMGQVFYEMGMLASAEVIECSASDLVAQFVGQTGPKTVNVLKKGLGKVLFIDEAYRLSEGNFAKEAIDELVDSLTKPQFLGKLVVVLAGYSENMNALLKVNPGLASRFPEEVIFHNMSAGECLTLLKRQVMAANVNFNFDIDQSDDRGKIIDLFTKLSHLESWGNGRDVKTISKNIVSVAYASAGSDLSSALEVSSKGVIEALEKMFAQQSARGHTKIMPILSKLSEKAASPPTSNFAKDLSISASSLPNMSTPSAPKQVVPTTVAEVERRADSDEKYPVRAHEVERDPDVSDTIWAELQEDKMANEMAERTDRDNIVQLEQSMKAVSNELEDSDIMLKKMEREEKANGSFNSASNDDSSDEERENEEKRRHEQARLRALKARLAVRQAEEKLRIAKVEEERKKKQEAVAQKKLRDLGICSAGFRWVKQNSGYRCQGGYHFVSDAALGI